jgi:transposase-like protein
MYARGMSQRDIEKSVKEMYGIEVSDSLISKITDKILLELEGWKSRTLEPIWMLWCVKLKMIMAITRIKPYILQ